MIKISKKQRDYLVENGAKYGADIHPTGNHHSKSYYLTTSRKMLNLLYEYETGKVFLTKQ